MTEPAVDRARPGDSALLVVDVQGRLARLMHESEAMIRALRILIRGCRMLDLPVVWAEQLPDKLGATVEELGGPLEGLAPTTRSARRPMRRTRRCRRVAVGR